ncbi:golgi reassembly stacking protein [Cavenderia fasciculata]|uniref:Golgi reassembly stacking protein n=1 Tax=Cavenderia fasciculata TaxID=261658 RepID=F4Q2W5_CACFS|nr:golgi reassembly stacking protein [Cavenderia fasciculata]EGG16741.1 golgi reassembly stacking protein [Cavenderia fasciculata]|eukprot:XP_004355215.1 golgi reassembly stacking protein [Cavenderia fasciculata]
MGQGQSQPYDEQQQSSSSSPPLQQSSSSPTTSSSSSNKQNAGDIYNKMGYHVLQVQPNSPACGRLVPFFDFIVAANQVVFDAEDRRFADIFGGNIGQSVNLIVYNIKSDTTREQVIVPSNTWGGSGLAGISIRFCSWEKTMEAVWHILDVYVNSPAHESGLQTKTDYIVGTPDMIFNDQDDFITLINNNMYRPIQLYVYSSLTEQVRLLTITPNKNWGGSGSLGCDIGYGLLHRIPTKQNITSQFVPIETKVTKQQQQQQQHPQQEEIQPLLQQQQQTNQQTLTLESVSPIQKLPVDNNQTTQSQSPITLETTHNNISSSSSTPSSEHHQHQHQQQQQLDSSNKPVATSSDQFTPIQF